MALDDKSGSWRVVFWLLSPLLGLGLIEAVHLEALPGGLVLAVTVWGVLGGALGIGGGYSLPHRWLLFPFVAISLDAALIAYWVAAERDVLWPLAIGTRVVWLVFVSIGAFAGSRIKGTDSVSADNHLQY